MSIYIHKSTASHSALRALDSTSVDPALASSNTLMFINPLILADAPVDDASLYPGVTESGIAWFKLSPLGNGVVQIAQILEQCPRTQSLHIYTTGAPGRLDLGQVSLTTENIERYAWELQSWFSPIPTYLTPTLVLGHCNVGDGPRGAEFIAHLRYLTGCHVRCLCSSSGHHLQLM